MSRNDATGCGPRTHRRRSRVTSSVVAKRTLHRRTSTHSGSRHPALLRQSWLRFSLKSRFRTPEWSSEIPIEDELKNLICPLTGNLLGEDPHERLNEKRSIRLAESGLLQNKRSLVKQTNLVFVEANGHHSVFGPHGGLQASGCGVDRTLGRSSAPSAQRVSSSLVVEFSTSSTGIASNGAYLHCKG